MTLPEGTPEVSLKSGRDDATLVRRWLIVFVVAGLFWRLVRFALAFPIWGDEAMLGLNVIGRSYRELLHPLQDVQVAPLGYLWVLRFTFDCLGVSDYTTRLPALAAGIVALLLFWHWAKLLVPSHAAVLATGLAALSGYIVRHGVELKPYANDFLVTVLLLLFATRYLISRRTIWLIALIVIQPVCSAISYPQVFVAGGIAVALLWSAIREDWSRRLLAALYCLVLGGSMLALFIFSARGQYESSVHGMWAYWRHGFPPGNPFKFIKWFVQIHTGNLFAYPIGGKSGASLGTVILFVIGLRAMWRSWSAPTRLMLFVPFLLTFIAAALRLYPYGESARVSQHLAPAILLATAAGMAAIIDLARSQKEWRRRMNVAGAILVAIAFVRLTGNVIWPYRTKADADVRSTIRSLLVAAGTEPIFVLLPPGEGPATLFWYLKERSRSYVHGMSPPSSAFVVTGNAWAITSSAAEERVGVQLAQREKMEWTSWSRQELSVGPKEDPPFRLQIAHLVRSGDH